MLTVKQAQDLINQSAKNSGIENISIHNAQGRVLAEDIFADRDYPPFNRAAMDGYAFNSKDFLEKGIRTFIITEEIYAGGLPTKKLAGGDCYKIMTGSSTPLDADTIIRVEDTEQKGNTVIFKTEDIKKGQNIAKKGEDKKENELVLKSSTVLHPPAIAALAVLGKSTLLVFKIPSVSIISTGNEVIPVDQPVLTHQIRDSNSYALKGFFENYNIPIADRRLVPDQKEKIAQAVSELIDSDILILSGGVSMGDADYVPEVLNSLGVEKIFHKVAIKPGKPLWFGKSRRGVVFALPGNPMSVQVAFKVFIEPFLRRSFGLQEQLFLKLPLAAGRKKKVKFDEYFPCSIEGEDHSLVRPVIFNGSGDVTSLLSSHGIGLQEAEREELKEGDIVKFYFW
jgi:molybdopterin molybdotransferase